MTDPSAEVNELFDKARLRAPDGTPLNIFGTLAHHPALLRRWLVFATHVLAKNSLTPRDRELLILRTGWRCDSQYEFSQHALIALRCDITDDEVQRTKLPVDERRLERSRCCAAERCRRTARRRPHQRHDVAELWLRSSPTSRCST